MNENEDAIVITDLVKRYSSYIDNGKRYLHRRQTTTETTILNGINMRIKKGEIVELIGRNGSGKSTLLKIIAGIIKPTSGIVKVNGEIVCIMETGMAFHNDLTGVDNIYLRGMYYGLSKNDVKNVINEIIEFSELGDAIYSPIKMYSTGMRSRLAFSIVTCIDADIYLFDEALNAGDVIFSRKSNGFLKKLSNNNKTVILTSHMHNMLEGIVNRTILLDGGVIAEEGRPNKVYSEYLWAKYRDADKMKDYADLEDSRAQLIFSKMNYEVDESQRAAYLKKSADNGNIDAMVEYIDMCFDEKNFSEMDHNLDIIGATNNESGMIKYAALRCGEDYKLLKEMLRDISNKGNHFDKYWFAEVMRILNVGEAGKKEIYQLYNESYEEGNVDAGYSVAMMTMHGYGTKIDVDASINILKKLGEMGHTKSCITLVDIYSYGKYVKIDEEQTFKWALKSAKCGDSKSQFRIAMMYKDGIGVKKDENESKKWLLTFLKNKMSHALITEAKTLEYYEHKTLMSADELYSLAMEGYNLKAINEHFSKLSLSQSKKDKEKMSETCNEYCFESQSRIFPCEHNMNFNSKNYDEKEIFRQMFIAANSGNPRAMYMLANMYSVGYGTEKDVEKYKYYIRAAARFNYNGAKGFIKDRGIKLRTDLCSLSDQIDKLKNIHKNR